MNASVVQEGLESLSKGQGNPDMENAQCVYSQATLPLKFKDAVNKRISSFMENWREWH